MRWSPSGAFEDEKSVQILAKGNNPRMSYSLIVSFAIPEARYGLNFVQIVRYGADDVMGYQFSVKPKLTVDPPNTTVGKQVTVTGTGFPDKDQGNIIMDGLTPGVPFIANSVGSFSISMPISETIAGSHKFAASSPKLFADAPIMTFDVGPSIKLSPENPEVGSNVTISGNGFAATSPVSVIYDSIQLPNTATTDSKGNFSHTFKITEGSQREHKIVVTDKAGNTARYGMPMENTPPPKPAILSPKGKDQTFGFIGSEMVPFSWTPVTDPSGVTYTLEIGENLEFFPLKPGMKKADLVKTSWSLEIPPGTYFWRVRAVDGAGNEGEWSVSPQFFKVGVLSIWYLVAGAAVILIVFVLLIRAFIIRLKDYIG